MTVNFYNTDSDNHALNKNLTNAHTKEINIREDVNVHEFNIIVSNIGRYNYAYIEELERYYFVNETYINENQSRLTFKCDVLMSFSEDILNLETIITRSSSNYSGYLNDNDFQAYAYEEIVCKKFPNEMNQDSIILMTIG